MATPRQEKLAKALIENANQDKPQSVGEVMKSVGYGTGLQKSPKRVLDSKGFQELMERYLPDDELVKVHKEGLRATTKKPHLVDRDDKGRPVYEYTDEDDFSTRHKYLETAYKLKGKYGMEDPNDKPKVNNTYNFIFNAETQEKIKAIEEEIKSKLINGNA